MNNYFSRLSLLLLIACCGQTAIQANNPMMMQDMPGFGMGNGSPINLNPFDQPTTAEDVWIEASHIRRALFLQPQITGSALKSIDHIIRASRDNELDQEAINGLMYSVRRYKKLADLCEKKPFNEKRYLEIEKLIEKRNDSALAIINHLVTIKHAQMIIQEIESDETLSPKDIQNHRNDFHALLKKEVLSIEKIQKTLEPYEKILLGDDRSFLEKYGPILLCIGATGTFISLVTMLSYTIQKGIHKVTGSSTKTPKPGVK